MGIFSKGGLFSKIVGAVPVVGGIASGIYDAVSRGKQANTNEREQLAQDAIARSRIAEDARQADQSNQLGRFNAEENARQFGITNAARQEGTNFDRVQQNRFAKMRAPMISGLLRGQNLRQPAEAPAANKYAPLIGR